MDKDTALRLALEAMKIKQQVTMWANDGDKAKFKKAIKAVEAALLSRSDGEAQTRSVDKDELLEALKASRTYVAYAYSNGIVGAEDVGHMLDAAIAKATGENNG